MVIEEFSDDRLRQLMTARQAVDWMRDAFLAHHRGDLVAPARAVLPLGDDQGLAFSGGRLRGAWFGYRSYDLRHTGAQIVAVHAEMSGAVTALAIGTALGPLRVGAIGAVAVDVLTPAEASRMALIGTGVQARAQLWGIGAVRDLSEVRVFSRDARRRNAFAAEAAVTCGATLCAVSSAREAVEGAEIVILATASESPVIDGAWLDPGAYVSTLGPKHRGRSELGADVVFQASALVTDSIAQLDSLGPAGILNGTAERTRLQSLGSLVAGACVPAEPQASPRVFFSVGLAGTEAYLLDRIAKHARSHLQ